MKKDKKKDSKEEKNAEHENRLAIRVREFIDGKFVTILMTLITLWALFGDDIRLAATDKPVDFWFYLSFLISLVLFFMELIATSIVFPEYKYSFFFWLDVIATISLIPDVPWIQDPFIVMFGSEPDQANVHVGSEVQGQGVSGYATRILKNFRLIRLVRIVKLYKYFTKSADEEAEAKLREAQKLATNRLQAKMNREMDPTRLGKRLSDLTTKRVIIGVLLLLLLLPILQVVPVDHAPYYGLQQIFWMGSNGCIKEDGHQWDSTYYANWINENGWYDLIYRYSKNSEPQDGDEEAFPLLWLHVPDPMNGSKIDDIKKVDESEAYTDREWKQDSDCNGFTVDNDWHLRDNEMLLVMYSPDDCSDIEACEELIVYARFDIKSEIQFEAIMNIVITVFVGIILAAGSVTFSIDTQNIVITPITKMVLIIKDLADDPMRKPKKPGESKTDFEEGLGGQTFELEKTIAKIGSLLQIAFGEDGAQIISKNMSGGDGDLDLMRPGSKISIIIGIIKLERFISLTEVLTDEMNLYLNKLSKVIHECANQWNGFVAVNDAGQYMLIWRLPEPNPRERITDELNNPQFIRTEMANNALICFAKIATEIKRLSEIVEYKTNAKIVKQFGNDFKTELKMSLHLGWAVEGAIGSERKIDAAYLSPHIELGYKLVECTDYYGSSFLISEALYGILSVKAKIACRKIDMVSVGFIKEPFGIYSYDLPEDTVQEIAEHEIGGLIKRVELESVNVEYFQNKGVEYMFTIDEDLLRAQNSLPAELYTTFREAFAEYVSGSWSTALENLIKCENRAPSDGPTKAMKRYIEEKGGTQIQAPEGWQGYREDFF